MSSQLQSACDPSQASNKALRHAYENLRDEHAKLQSAHFALREDHAYLKSRYEHLMDKYEQVVTKGREHAQKKGEENADGNSRVGERRVCWHWKAHGVCRYGQTCRHGMHPRALERRA
ncbi:hypothetical protein BU26DRAFT_517752 [Trematosphaeria pertusa]|uniref:C3H1-type domain-containing protein n=1 Tax=Trematosphaeria pertusa TaxID=390896 RepID=A0A6A6IMF5_9PLEO|nr:uncharacterized protein BU26DRAFT_517752 [Trematosphaeria pertusa]KAF2251002.1 hypothetical protein BU26DRAFT_517752 [Trematosphaeria pertusa]